MYQLRDCLFPCRLYADGHIFKNKKEILETLIAYHDVDFTGVDKNDDEVSIKEYFQAWGINGFKNQLNYLLDYGEWEIIEVNFKNRRH